jgi:hypothetical protein
MYDILEQDLTNIVDNIRECLLLICVTRKQIEGADVLKNILDAGAADAAKNDKDTGRSIMKP